MRRRHLLAALPLFASGLIKASAARAAPVLRVGAALPDPPFEFTVNDGPAGFDITLMQRIAGMIGREWTSNWRSSSTWTRTKHAWRWAMRETAGTKIATLDHPPAGWFVLDVVQGQSRTDWVALMVDVDPEDLKTCQCTEGPAFLYVDPKDYRPGDRKAQQCWVRIPGKHRGLNSACDALENLRVTRH